MACIFNQTLRPHPHSRFAGEAHNLLIGRETSGDANSPMEGIRYLTSIYLELLQKPYLGGR